MALQVPLANDKKRVKVYELRDNDWFDRGTGFCTGQVINVSMQPVSPQNHIASRMALLLCGSELPNQITDCLCHRTSRAYSSSQRTNRSECCWRHGLSRTTDIRNNKVCRKRASPDVAHVDTLPRHTDSMDRNQRYRHGIELPRGRWLRSHLVSLGRCNR